MIVTSESIVIPQSKSAIIENKQAIRYLAGQERMCRLSGVAQRITPQLLTIFDLETRTCTEFARLPCSHGQHW